MNKLLCVLFTKGQIGRLKYWFQIKILFATNASLLATIWEAELVSSFVCFLKKRQLHSKLKVYGRHNIVRKGHISTTFQSTFIAGSSQMASTVSLHSQRRAYMIIVSSNSVCFTDDPMNFPSNDPMILFPTKDLIFFFGLVQLLEAIRSVAQSWT